MAQRGRPPKNSKIETAEETPTERMTEFVWKLARPDSRQYRQQSTELEPQDIIVGVSIPREFWHDDEMTLLTPRGVRYALDCLGEELLDSRSAEVETEDFGEVSDDDWVGSTEETTSSDGDDWGSETDEEDDDTPPWEVNAEPDEEEDNWNLDNEENWEA